MIYLLFYDISSDKIRTKLAKRLIAEGFERIQYSVMVGLRHPKKSPVLWQQLTTWVEADVNGSIFIVACTIKQFKAMELLGAESLDLDYLLGLRSVIFI